MDYLDTLSRFAAELDYTSLPPAVREQTSWVLADPRSNSLIVRAANPVNEFAANHPQVPA